MSGDASFAEGHTRTYLWLINPSSRIMLSVHYIVYHVHRSNILCNTVQALAKLYIIINRDIIFHVFPLSLCPGDGPTQFDSTSDRPTQFDSAGGIYHNTAHGVVITIPEGAIPENLVIKLDVKVTLTSTLKLPEDYRSVSPITELCIKNDPQFKFLKPIEVILPHFLDINDHETLPICFMKAEHGSDHFKHLDKNQEQSFDYHNYATLKTNHLCHLCIAAGKTEVRDKFNLIRVIPQVRPASGWSMYFYVIYDLPTCKSVRQVN